MARRCISWVRNTMISIPLVFAYASPAYSLRDPVFSIYSHLIREIFIPRERDFDAS